MFIILLALFLVCTNSWETSEGRGISDSLAGKCSTTFPSHSHWLCLSVVFCWAGSIQSIFRAFSLKNNWLLWLKTTLIRAVRVNQNSKVVSCKTKTMSWKTPKKLMIILCRFITVSYSIHIQVIMWPIVNIKKLIIAALNNNPKKIQ